MSLEESNDTSHEYGPLHPEQQLSNYYMEVHPYSQDFEDNDEDIVQPVLIFKRAVCKNCYHILCNKREKDSCIK
jgi:hypothetical protein